VYVFGALSTWMTCAFANPVCPWLIRHLTWAEVGAAAAEGGGAAGVACGLRARHRPQTACSFIQRGGAQKKKGEQKDKRRRN
jgi:hypothetical protein